MTIITVSGSARHGKDTFCDYLKVSLTNRGKRVLRINYADYLKYLASQFYGWTGLKDESGRTLLQQLGTEKIRSKNPNFWVDAVINFIEVVQDDFDFVLIADARFPNEILRWVEEGADIIPVHITRLNFHNGLTKEQQNHKSETALDDFEFDYYIAAETIDDLEYEVVKFVNSLKSEGYL